MKLLLWSTNGCKNQVIVVSCQGAIVRWCTDFWHRRQLLKTQKRKLTGCGSHCQRLFINYQFNHGCRRDITETWLKVLIDYEDHLRRVTKKCTKQLILFHCYQRHSDDFTSREAEAWGASHATTRNCKYNSTQLVMHMRLHTKHRSLGKAEHDKENKGNIKEWDEWRFKLYSGTCWARTG